MISYYAVLKTGVITIELDTENGTDDIKFLLNDCEAMAIIIQRKYLKQLDKIIDDLPFLNFIISDEIPKEANDSKFYIDFEQICSQFVGQKKGMVKVGANRIKEVEETLLENHEIHEVAVIGK